MFILIAPRRSLNSLEWLVPIATMIDITSTLSAAGRYGKVTNYENRSS